MVDFLAFFFSMFVGFGVLGSWAFIENFSSQSNEEIKRRKWADFLLMSNGILGCALAIQHFESKTRVIY